MRHFNISDGPDIFLIKDFSPKRWMMSDLTWGEMESQPAYLQPIITQYFIDNKSEIWLLFLIAHSKRWRFNAFIDY